jgi:hypothetical protein
VAEPVLLISSDPHLGESLEALARGRLRVASLDPGRRLLDWPEEAPSAVVLDVGAERRDAAFAWVRRHHHGPVVVLLKPGERDRDPTRDPDRLVIGRPFRLADLLAALAQPPAPPAPAAAVAPAPDPGQGSSDLLQASATQRRRRLGALSAATTTAPGRPSGRSRPPADEGLPRPDWPTAASQLEERRRRRRRRRRGRRVLGRLLLAALVGLAVGAAWLAFGLLEAREDLQVGATAVRTQLAAAEAALGRGDPAVALAAVRAAERNLDFAEAVPDRRELRVAARLPLLSSTVADTRHLLAAARRLTAAGERATAVLTRLRAAAPAPGRGRFDLAAIDDAAGEARALQAELDGARGELGRVRGGLLAPGVDGARDWAQARLEAADARARPLVPTLAALPAALGAGEARTYLVVLTNPAELRPGGGAPLATLELALRDGAATPGRAGRLAGDAHATQPAWTAVPGDPWASGGRFDELSLATSSPHFPTAGEELLRAQRARGRPRADGVLAVDPLAMQALLAATGPVQVPGYGELDAAGCVRRVSRDAYLRWPDPAARQRFHQAVLEALVARLAEGRDLVASGRVLAAAGARRSVQALAADAGLRRVLALHRMDGALAGPGGDFLAVHTLNRNRSRVDLFQQRTIHQRVRLGRDGTAEVSRTVTVTNAVPAGEPLRADAAAGDGSARAAAVLATYLPPGAAVTSTTLDGRPVRPATASERGRPLLRVEIDLRPGRSAVLTVGYRLPAAAARDGDGLRYVLGAQPQALADPPELRIEVTAPPGMAFGPAAGWTVRGGTATLARPFADPVTAALDLHG